jgi:hypothetical protein
MVPHFHLLVLFSDNPEYPTPGWLAVWRCGWWIELSQTGVLGSPLYINLVSLKWLPGLVSLPTRSEQGGWSKRTRLLDAEPDLFDST